MITQKQDQTSIGTEPAGHSNEAATNAMTVFVLWCRLTGNDPAEFGLEEREAFQDRPQVASLMTIPYEVLLDAGITAARRGSLPLERWLGAVRTVRPAAFT